MDELRVTAINVSTTDEEKILSVAASADRSDTDVLYLYDTAGDEVKKDALISTLRKIRNITGIPFFALGSVKKLEDVKKTFYSGASKVVLAKDFVSKEELFTEAVKKIGKENVILADSEDFTGFLPDNAKQVYSFVIPDVWELLRESKINKIPFSDLKKNEAGLVPVIVQDYLTNEVLMMAWQNEKAYDRMFETGKMTYYSRSRDELWIKGETSGHYQYLKELSIDCDSDTLLAKVKQVGVACHTGNRSCFFTEMYSSKWKKESISDVLTDVFDVILDRKKNPKEGSYTNYLFDKGIDKILKKCGEEATEIVIAAKNPDPEEIKYEIADFLYHVMVLMAEKGVSWNDIAMELANR